MDASYLGRGAYRPINPHGRPMPSDWKSPRSESLYRVYVSDDATGELKPVSPAVLQAGAEHMLKTIKTALSCGQLHGWSDPHLVLAFKGR